MGQGPFQFSPSWDPFTLLRARKKGDREKGKYKLEGKGVRPALFKDASVTYGAELKY